MPTTPPRPLRATDVTDSITFYRLSVGRAKRLPLPRPTGFAPCRLAPPLILKSNYLSKHFPLLVSTAVGRRRLDSTTIGSRLLTRTSGPTPSVGCSLPATPRRATSTPPDVDREDLTLPIIASFPGSPGVDSADRHACLYLGLGLDSYLGSRTRLLVD